jgi:two-component system, sensor histidine kinase PdtaS
LPGDNEAARARLAILAEFGRETSLASVDALLQRACTIVANALSVARSKTLCYRPSQGDLLIVSGVGWHEGVVGHATLKTDLASPPGRAFQTALPVTVDD